MQTEFVRSLNCNYERVLLDKKPEEKRYQYCIMNRGGIRGLLPCSLRYINGSAYLYYDISSKQNMKQLYSSRCVSRAWVKDFLWSLQQVRQELDRFLLDAGNLLFYPEQIFQDLESNIFSFVYVPYYRDGQEDSGFSKLMEFLVEHIDYNDETLVECIYHIYEQVEENGDIYLQARIFEDARRLDEPVKLPEKKAESKLPEQESEQKAEESVQQPDAAVEQRKHFFSIFENRKKKNRDLRESYQQDMQEIMSGYAVAEETEYEEYGRTIYIEEPPEQKERPRRLCTPAGKVLMTLEGTSVSIGKRKGEAEIVLDNASVSRLHARIVREGDVYYIEDLNSTNGTFKNGLRLQPYEKRELEEGDEIKVGRVDLVFK